jgi:hypothetical protein
MAQGKHYSLLQKFVNYELKQCLSLKTNICRRGFVFIGLGFKCLPVSNALAYFAVALVATKIVLFCWCLEKDEEGELEESAKHVDDAEHHPVDKSQILRLQKVRQLH